jgi:hypothetical protein
MATDFSYKCIGQDILVPVLGPFQHDRNFTNFFATVYTDPFTPKPYYGETILPAAQHLHTPTINA